MHTNLLRIVLIMRQSRLHCVEHFVVQDGQFN